MGSTKAATSPRDLGKALLGIKACVFISQMSKPRPEELGDLPMITKSCIQIHLISRKCANSKDLCRPGRTYTFHPFTFILVWERSGFLLSIYYLIMSLGRPNCIQFHLGKPVGGDFSENKETCWVVVTALGMRSHRVTLHRFDGHLLLV